jgi:hypothetical protein
MTFSLMNSLTDQNDPAETFPSLQAYKSLKKNQKNLTGKELMMPICPQHVFSNHVGDQLHFVRILSLGSKIDPAVNVMKLFLCCYLRPGENKLECLQIAIDNYSEFCSIFEGIWQKYPWGLD